VSEAAALIEQVRARGKASEESALAMLQLYPLSPIEDRRRLLDLAARGLPARAVVGALIELAAAEEDDELRERLLALLFFVDAREVPDLAAWVSLLSRCLQQERVRARAAACLGRIVAGSAAAQEALIAATRAARDRVQQRALLAALCALQVPPPAVRSLFVELLDAVDEDAKAALLARILATGPLPAATLARLLVPTEPVQVKLLALQHAISLPSAGEDAAAIDAALASVLAKEPEPICRARAAQALAARGTQAAAAPAALLQALRADPDAGVRKAAALAFQHSLARTPQALAALAAALASERTRDGLALVLTLISSHAGQSPEVRSALIQLLQQGLRADAAVLVYQALGRLAQTDPSLAATVRAALVSEQDDRVRRALLEAILREPDAEGRHLPLYLAALRSSDAALRTLGVRGLLRVPLEPQQCEGLGAAVDALADARIDRWARAPLAQKLARLTAADPQRALAPRFKKVAPQIEDAEVRAACEEAADRAAAAQGAANVDWAEWFQRADVEGRTDGIFPGLFVHFDEDPEQARRVLRACLNPPAAGTLYNTYRGQIREETLVAFLHERGLVDDDLSRWCLSQLLDPTQHGGGAFYLNVLRSNPRFPSLREDVWRLLEARKDAPPVLLRELIRAAYDTDEAAGAELSRRVQQPGSAAQALPWLRFLLGNAVWPAAQAAFAALPLQAAPYQEPEARELVEQITKAMARELPKAAAEPQPQPQGNTPGLADD
jgi:hypothetical protein